MRRITESCRGTHGAVQITHQSGLPHLGLFPAEEELLTATASARLVPANKQDLVQYILAFLRVDLEWLLRAFPPGH